MRNDLDRIQLVTEMNRVAHAVTSGYEQPVIDTRIDWLCDALLRYARTA